MNHRTPCTRVVAAESAESWNGLGWRRALPALACCLAVLAMVLSVAVQRAQADFTVELHPDNDVRIVNDAPLPGMGSTGLVDTDVPLSNQVAAMTVNFPEGSPAIYTRDSERSIDLILDGQLPGGSSATVVAWDVAQQQFVDSFNVRLGGDSWSIPAESLEVIPDGRVELRVELTAPDLRTVQVAQEYLFLPPGLDPELVDTWYDPPTPEEVEEELRNIPDFEPVAGMGFVPYEPAEGSQVYYVAEAGSDSNDGLSPERPLRTLRSALDRVGDKDGDSILLKAGDTFKGGFGSLTKSGRSVDMPLFIGVYGNGDRPIVHTEGDGFIQAFGFVSNVVIDGIYAYANDRDPDSGVAGYEYGVRWLAAGKNLTIQDCKFQGFKYGAAIQGLSPRAINNVTIRRSIFVDQYGHYLGSKAGHSSGIYLSNVYNGVIDECVFDHNGWNENKAGAHRTKFNHNVYVQKNCEGVDVYRSIFSRGSHHGLQLRPGGIVQDNLFYRNALACLVAQAPSVVENNVVLEADDMDPSDKHMHRGDGLEVLPCSHAVVRNNIILNKVGQAGHAGAIEVEWRSDVIDPPSEFYVEIYDNIVLNHPMSWEHDSIMIWTESAEVVRRDNIRDKTSGGDSDPVFVDGTRTMDNYVPGGFDEFITQARNRPRGTWDPVYTSASFNNWMRAGYTPR